MISYSQRIEGTISIVKKTFGDLNELWRAKASIQALIGGDLIHCRKFYSRGIEHAEDLSNIERLLYEDYEHYLVFFQSQNPGVSEEWLRTHFVRQIQQKYAYGMFCDGRLVCVSDVPNAPYLTNIIVEPTISTLRKYRTRGYAKKVSLNLIQYLESAGKIPIFSCNIHHKASVNLAKSLGLIKFCDVIAIKGEAKWK